MIYERFRQYPIEEFKVIRKIYSVAAHLVLVKEEKFLKIKETIIY